MRRNVSGFTIVELLIVIVVIGILAAITVVAYNGIQQRARNSARLSAAQGIWRELEAYTRQEGKNWVTINFCIPTDANRDPGGGNPKQCYKDSAPRYENATMNAQFAAAGFQFSYPDTPITASGDTYRGIHVAYASNLNQGVNGVLQPHLLFFFLEGNDQDCGTHSVRQDGPKIASDPLNSLVPGRNFQTTAPGVTMCAYSLTYYTSI